MEKIKKNEKMEEKRGRGRPKKIIKEEKNTIFQNTQQEEEEIEEKKEEKKDSVIIDKLIGWTGKEEEYTKKLFQHTQQEEEKKEEKNIEIEEIYIIDWIYRTDLTIEEKNEILKEEKYYKIPKFNGLGYIYDCDKDTAVYMLRYLIKWIFGSRELGAIIVGNIMNIAIIVLLIITIIMTAMKPSLNAIKGVIPLANNSQIIKKEIRETNNVFSGAIIK